MTFKPYVPKPLTSSPRDQAILDSRYAYLLKVGQPQGDHREAEVSDPGQALAVLRACKDNGIRCLVYAIGKAYGEKGLALVDDAFLLNDMHFGITGATMPPRRDR